jgi:hypothetical protein
VRPVVSEVLAGRSQIQVPKAGSGGLADHSVKGNQALLFFGALVALTGGLLFGVGVQQRRF